MVRDVRFASRRESGVDAAGFAGFGIAVGDGSGLDVECGERDGGGGEDGEEED